LAESARKKWCLEDIDAIAHVGKDKVQVSMEVVAREERICSPVEGTAIASRFKDEWVVPFVDVGSGLKR